MVSTKALGGILIVAGAVAALVTLFGPSGRVAGIDLGATGATVFMLSLAGTIWLFAVRGAEIFPEHMSIAERRVWLGLVFLVVALAIFAREVQMLVNQGSVPDAIDTFFGRRFIERYVTIGIAWAVMWHLIGRGEPGMEGDERDLRLRHRADRVGDLTLSLAVVAGIAALATVPREQLSWWLTPVVLANMLVGLMIGKILVEHLALVLAYRRTSSGE